MLSQNVIADVSVCSLCVIYLLVIVIGHMKNIERVLYLYDYVIAPILCLLHYNQSFLASSYRTVVLYFLQFLLSSWTDPSVTDAYLAKKRIYKSYFAKN